MKTLLFMTSALLCHAAPRAIPVDVAAPRYHRATVQGITLHAVSFDARSHRLRLLDQPNGPGTLWADAQTAAKSVQGLAAINAGFFTPEGKPLGVMISDGKKLSKIMGNIHDFKMRKSQSLNTRSIYDLPSKR